MLTVYYGVAHVIIQEGTHGKKNIISSGFSILNDSNLPTFSNHIGESHIDVSLSTVPDKFKLWLNTQSFNGSDHSLILMSLSCNQPVVERLVRNIALTNWQTFSVSLPSLDFTPITSTGDLERQAKILIDNISLAFDAACPLKRAYPGKPCKWWNKGLSNLLRKKNLAAKEMRRYKGTQRGIRAYKKKKALGKLFFKISQREKESAWHNFISNMNSPRNISSLLKSMSERKPLNIPFLTDKNGQVARTHEENLEALRSAHFEGSTVSYNINQGDSHNSNRTLPWELDNFFTLDLLEKAINELPSGKAPGPDGIKNEVLRHLPREYKCHLLEQIRQSVRLSFLPTSWLEIETIYIKKANKPNYNTPKAYRPIGLSSSILKLSERLVNWRIKSTVLKDGIPGQHAFTVNRSTETAISELINFIEKAKYNNMKAIILSIDIEGAFDNLPFEMIKESLLAHGADNLIAEWIDYLSKNRHVFSTLGGIKAFFRPLKGTTQGGLNGPDLWIIFLWNIIFTTAAKATRVSKYADDLISALMGKDLNVIRDILQTALDEFVKWFEARGLKISPLKTFCMIIGKSRNEPIPKPLKINGEPVPYVQQMTYLGVIIDSNLTWKPHIQNRIATAKRNLMLARRLISLNWGLNPEKMMWIYEGIVRPSLDYSCHLWTPVGNPPSWLMKALDRVQRLALLCITLCQGSTPTRALERLTNLPPLYLHLKAKAATTVARIYNVVGKSNWDGIGANSKRGHLFRWGKYLGPQLPPVLNPSLLNLTKFEVCWNKPDSPATLGWNIYTDGSKLDNKVGLGWIITKGDVLVSQGNRSLPHYCSVFEAEILAISLAIDDFCERISHKQGTESVTIYVDNQAALHTINKTKIVGEHMISLIQKLTSLRTNSNINPTFCWIKSHTGNTGNELADAQAKLGTVTPYLLQNAPKPSLTFIKNTIKSRIRKEWDDIWNSLTDCRQSRQFVSFNPNKSERSYLLSRSRIRCKKLVALLTGHNNLRYHTFKRKVASDPNFSPCCRFCLLDVESSWHLMYDCPALDQKRRELIYGPQNPKKGPDIKVLEARADHLGILDIILDSSD